jgi:hypothetical protein
MSVVENIVEDLLDLQAADRESRSPEVKARLRRITERRVDAQQGIPKAVAARMLGISVNTLDKWIARGRVAVLKDTRSGRTLVATVPFARLLNEVRDLRAAGATEGILAAAIARLEREDPQYQREFAKLYGAGIAAMNEGRLKPVELPEAFGPED